MRRGAALGFLTALLTACGGGESAPAPPDIAFGRDVCVSCGMIISDPTFAAAYEFVGADRVFDDIGEMLDHGLDTGELTAGTPAWVHDLPSGRWIPAAAAWLVEGGSNLAPMGSALVAFAEEDDATNWIAQHGGILRTWDDLLHTPAPTAQSD